MWRENKILQEVKEEDGLKPSLSINVNAELAFKYALMTLYKDDLFGKRSFTVQSDLRKGAIKDYGSKNGASTERLWYPIMQKHFLAKRLKTAQIVSKRISPALKGHVQK